MQQEVEAVDPIFVLDLDVHAELTPLRVEALQCKEQIRPELEEPFVTEQVARHGADRQQEAQVEDEWQATLEDLSPKIVDLVRGCLACERVLLEELA